MEHNHQIPEDESLSQDFYHMSPFKIDSKQQTFQSMNDIVLRKILGQKFHSTPDYLSMKNCSLKNELNSILPVTLSFKEIYDVALIMHKILSIELIQSLWLTYHKSMMGTLQCSSSLSVNHLDRQVCPTKVQSYMKQCQIENSCDKEIALNFMHHCQQQLNYQDEQYRHELNRKTCCLTGYTPYINTTIEKFMEQGLQPFRIKINQKIALQQYDYTNELLRRAYLTLNPNENQIKIYKRLCKLMQRAALTKHEVDILKKKIALDQMLHSFERDFSAPVSCLPCIDDANLEENGFNELKEITKQARDELINITVEYTEMQRRHYEQFHNKALNDIRSKEQTLPASEKLTLQMWKLIEQAQVNISARVECLYKFKFQLYHFESNKR